MAHSMVAPRAGGELVPFTQWDIERRGIKAHYDLVSGGVQPSIPIPTHLHQCTSATRGHCGVAHRWPSLLEASWLRTTKSVPVPQDGALFLVAVLWACLASMVIQHRFRVTPASCQPVAMAAILGKQIDPKRDYYAELGVACTASAAEIKIAFRKMALEVHPDVSTQPESTAQFLKVNQAYQVLSKPLDRQTYDSLRKLSVSSYSPFRTSPTTVPPAPPQYQRYASPKPHAPYNVYHDFDDTYGINNSDMHHRHQRKPPPRAKAKPKPKPKPKAHARGLKDQPKRVWGGPGQRTSASHRPPGWADMGFLDEDEYDIDSSNIDDDLTDDDSVFEESYFNHHAKAGGGADMYSETDGFEFDNMDGPSAVSDGDSDGEAAEIEAGTRGLEISPQEVYNSASALMRAALASQLLAMLQAGGFQYNDAAPGNEHVMRRSVKLKCFLQVNTCIQDSGYTQKVHRHNPGIRVAAIYQPSEKPSVHLHPAFSIACIGTVGGIVAAVQQAVHQLQELVLKGPTCPKCNAPQCVTCRIPRCAEGCSAATEAPRQAPSPGQPQHDAPDQPQHEAPSGDPNPGHPQPDRIARAVFLEFLKTGGFTEHKRGRDGTRTFTRLLSPGQCQTLVTVKELLEDPRHPQCVVEVRVLYTSRLGEVGVVEGPTTVQLEPSCHWNQSVAAAKGAVGDLERQMQVIGQSNRCHRCRSPLVYYGPGGRKKCLEGCLSGDDKWWAFSPE
eukprot:GGOE01022432.1.p1 GENE.GGOE01022432.1~~GGOE01022432.1.p1  ORF type:complete len:726 (+),score=96.49 GGOE01022432.1:82-2259(+)